MPRANPADEYVYDSEIERTLRALRRSRREQRANLADISDSEEEGSTTSSSFGDNSVMGEAPERRTVREMISPVNLNLKPRGTVLPDHHGHWDLKSGFIMMLPKFNDWPGEDPQRHLQDFELACESQRVEDGMKEYVKLIAFPFSLHEGAREWLYLIPERTITDWGSLQRAFLDRYYPAARVQAVRRRINNLRMGANESFYDYWNRFRMMTAKCPQHRIPQIDLVQYFMDGLRTIEKQQIRAACGGSTLNKDPDEAMRLFSEMAEESRDDDTTAVVVNEGKPEEPPHVPHTAPTSGGVTQDQFQQLISAIKESNLIRGQGTEPEKNIARRPVRPVRMCQLCKDPTHHTDECPTIQEEEGQDVNGIWENQQGWRNNNHQGGRYQGHNGGAQPYAQNNFQGQNSQGQPQHHQVAQLHKRMEEMENRFEKKMKEMQKGIQASAMATGNQITQLATAIADLSKQQGKLPSQVQPNLMKNVSAVLLRSGKVLARGTTRSDPTSAPDEEAEKQAIIEEEEADEDEQIPKNARGRTRTVEDELKKYNPGPLPFPNLTKQELKEKKDMELRRIFSKVEVNIPLLDAIRQIPRYSKFLKDLCTKKVRFEENAHFVMSENCSAILQQDLPEKCGDPGVFSIPVNIGGMIMRNAMLDLGASINVMPLSIYEELNLGHMRHTRAIIQLADHSTITPKGLLEDVLVKVKELIFPADFYVIDT